MAVYKFKLDIEIGTLVKSPCKDCEKRAYSFPECIETCEVLNRIQSILAELRFCSKG